MLKWLAKISGGASSSATGLSELGELRLQTAKLRHEKDILNVKIEALQSRQEQQEETITYLFNFAGKLIEKVNAPVAPAPVAPPLKLKVWNPDYLPDDLTSEEQAQIAEKLEVVRRGVSKPNVTERDFAGITFRGML